MAARTRPLPEVAALVDATPVVCESDGPVSGVHCSDLLSEVLANAPESCLWVTVQNHRNVVAVAETRDVTAILVAGGRPVLHETRRHAEALEVSIYASRLPVYEIAGRLHRAGIGLERN